MFRFRCPKHTARSLAVSPRLSILVALALTVAAIGAPNAAADGSAGPDPSANIVPGAMPDTCGSAPTGAACVNGAIYWLDQARESMGRGPYELPSDFVSLAPDQQAFILTNLDRTSYGAAPITSLTAALDADAAHGVQVNDDPMSSDPDFDYFASNWAGAFTNMPLAYDMWAYDDGYGSGNLDCSTPTASGCWGHRHDILWQFDDVGGPLAMGAFAGPDAQGAQGYAMLLGEGDDSYQPTYTYTWSEAQAAGAGANTYDPGLPQIPVNVTVTVNGPGAVSDPDGNTCSEDESPCTFEETQGVSTALTATPDSGAALTGWSGACSGAGACSLTPAGSSTAVTARFAATPASGRPKQPGKSKQPTGAKLKVRVRVAAHRISAQIAAPPSAQLRCALSRHTAKGWPRAVFVRCGHSVTYARLSRGQYRFEVRTSTSTATLYLTVK